MKKISTENAPKAIGPYSQAIMVNGLLFVSGQLPIDPSTGVFVPGGAKEQTRQCLLNAQAIIETADMQMNNVVKTTVLLANMDDFAVMNEVYAQFFSEPYPARAAFQVAKLPKDALVEIELIVVK